MALEGANIWGSFQTSGASVFLPGNRWYCCSAVAPLAYLLWSSHLYLDTVTMNSPCILICVPSTACFRLVPRKLSLAPSGFSMEPPYHVGKVQVAWGRLFKGTLGQTGSEWKPILGALNELPPLSGLVFLSVTPSNPRNQIALWAESTYPQTEKPHSYPLSSFLSLPSPTFSGARYWRQTSQQVCLHSWEEPIFIIFSKAEMPGLPSPFCFLCSWTTVSSSPFYSVPHAPD